MHATVEGCQDRGAEGEAGASPAEGAEDVGAEEEEEEAQQKQGRRWTRQEKGSWVDNRRFMDEVRSGLMTWTYSSRTLLCTHSHKLRFFCRE